MTPEEKIKDLDAKLQQLGVEHQVQRMRAHTFESAIKAVQKEAEPVKLRTTLLEKEIAELQRQRQNAVAALPPPEPPSEPPPQEPEDPPEPPDTPPE